MSAIILFLYSKYYPNIDILLNIVTSIDYIHTICIDNDRVREVIMRSSLLREKKVPCFVVIFPDRSVHQYVDEDMSTFVESLISKVENKEKGDGKKTPINSLVSEIPETTINIQEELDPEIEDEIAKEVNNPAVAPRHQNIPMKQAIKAVKDVPSNKTDIGKLINFTEGNPEASGQKKSTSVSRSRSELMNRENIKIPRGKGHESMNSSSLGTDIVTTKSKEAGDDTNIIEDIGEEEQVIPFTPDDISGQIKNTHKSKQDLKTLAMEMANGRDVIEK